MQDYRESKATDSNQNLEIFERHFNEIVQNVMKIESLVTSFNFEELVLKIELEMTKECKDFKFQQNLRLECKKDAKVPFKTQLIDSQLNSYKVVFDYITIDELLDKQHNDFSPELKTEHMKVWVIVFIQYCNINQLSPNSLFLLPQEPDNSMEGLINI